MNDLEQEDHELNLLIEELDIPKNKKQKAKIQKKRGSDYFELFFIRIRQSFESLYRFSFFAIVCFFAVNLIVLLSTITFIYLILTVNHVLIPLARTAGLY